MAQYIFCVLTRCSALVLTGLAAQAAPPPLRGSEASNTPRKSGNNHVCSRKKRFHSGVVKSEKTLLPKASWHKSWFVVLLLKNTLQKNTQRGCIYLWVSDEGFFFFFTAASLAAIMSGVAGGVGDYSLWSITYLLTPGLSEASLHANAKLSLISPTHVKTVEGWWVNVRRFLSHRVHLKGRGGKRNESELFRLHNCIFYATHVSWRRDASAGMSHHGVPFLFASTMKPKAAAVITAWGTQDAAEP